ncbi:Type II secretion system protein D precursor [Planctomycetes bacterium Pan216]|uniref:Type II secretion system protein D n=1 Tax=Kolteria novifilia TaxID=2527975 RepID=A0A518B7E5_9BACT|nr:Type II secretion system protein D precursor [Planctomycetes bacterium Pan216]
MRRARFFASALSVCVGLSATEFAWSQTSQPSQTRIVADTSEPGVELREGIRLFRRGDYEQSARAFRAAREGATRLSEKDREVLDDFQRRTRAALQSRAQAQAELGEAERAFKAGDHTTAFNLVKRVTANRYLSEEERQRVDALGEELRGDKKQGFWSNVFRRRGDDSETVTVEKPKVEESSIKAASHAEMVPTPPIPSQGETMTRTAARELLANGREWLSKGHLEQAERFAKEASRYQGYWLFGDTPDKLLRDIEVARQQQPDGKETQGYSDGKKAKPSNGAPAEEAESSAPRGTSIRKSDSSPSIAAAGSSNEINRQRALSLLREARRQMGAGQYDQARTLCLQAKQLNVMYRPFDETPDKLLGYMKSAAPASGQPTPKNVDPEKARQQAQSLLVQAESSLRQGKLDQAEQYLKSAESLAGKDANLGWKSSQLRKGLAFARQQKNAMNTAAKATASSAPSPKKQQAIKLVSEARKALNEGQYPQAVALAQRAKAMNVTFADFEDSPERILQAHTALRKRTQDRKDPQSVQRRVAQARHLMHRSRRLMKVGLLEEAAREAQLAAVLKAPLGKDEEKPEDLLVEIKRKLQERTDAGLAQTTPTSAPPATSMPASNASLASATKPTSDWKASNPEGAAIKTQVESLIRAGKLQEAHGLAMKLKSGNYNMHGEADTLLETIQKVDNRNKGLALLNKAKEAIDRGEKTQAKVYLTYAVRYSNSFDATERRALADLSSMITTGQATPSTALASARTTKPATPVATRTTSALPKSATPVKPIPTSTAIATNMTGQSGASRIPVQTDATAAAKTVQPVVSLEPKAPQQVSTSSTKLVAQAKSPAKMPSTPVEKKESKPATTSVAKVTPKTTTPAPKATEKEQTEESGSLFGRFARSGKSKVRTGIGSMKSIFGGKENEAEATSVAKAEPKTPTKSTKTKTPSKTSVASKTPVTEKAPGFATTSSLPAPPTAVANKTAKPVKTTVASTMASSKTETVAPTMASSKTETVAPTMTSSKTKTVASTKSPKTKTVAKVESKPAKSTMSVAELPPPPPIFGGLSKKASTPSPKMPETTAKVEQAIAQAKTPKRTESLPKLDTFPKVDKVADTSKGGTTSDVASMSGVKTLPKVDKTSAPVEKVVETSKSVAKMPEVSKQVVTSIAATTPVAKPAKESAPASTKGESMIPVEAAGASEPIPSVASKRTPEGMDRDVVPTSSTPGRRSIADRQPAFQPATELPIGGPAMGANDFPTRFTQGKASVSDTAPAPAPSGTAKTGTAPGATIPGARTTSDRDLIQESIRRERVLAQKLRQETINSLTRAGQLFTSEPESAIALLESTRATIKESALSSELTQPLVRQLDRRIQDYQNQRKRLEIENIAQRRSESIVEGQLNKEQIDLQKQQQIKELSKRFNALMDEGRFSEAETVAYQVTEIDPDEVFGHAALWRARLARHYLLINEVEEKKQEGFWEAIYEVEKASIPRSDAEPLDFPDAKFWEDLTTLRAKYRDAVDLTEKSEATRRIEQALKQPIDIDFQDTTLRDAVEFLQDSTGVNIVLDQNGLDILGLDPDVPVTLSLQGVSLKSALRLILKPMELTFLIQDEVLLITDAQETGSELVTRVYPVADLVIPIIDFNSGGIGLAGSLGGGNAGQGALGGGGQGGGGLGGGGGGFGGGGGGFGGGGGGGGGFGGGGGGGGFGGGGGGGGQGGLGQGDTGEDIAEDVMELIRTTIATDTWEENGGLGSIGYFEPNRSFVVTQTQEVHEQLADMFTQLRRLQDLQITVEVRFVDVTEEFFERIGIDFDVTFDNNNDDWIIQSDPTANQLSPPGNPLPLVNANNVAPAGPGNTARADGNHVRGVTVGRDPSGNFLQNFNIPVSQSSFAQATVPALAGLGDTTLGGTNFGIAFLNDIDVFLLMEAVQGDRRQNLVTAPKVTMFNGQTASVIVSRQVPFVTGATSNISAGAAAFDPTVSVINDGTTLQVQAVVSADRRFVRIQVIPLIQSIEPGSTRQIEVGATAGGSGLVGSAGTATATIELPTVAVQSVQTTVNVPDGGTILLGGLKTHQEARNEFGTPVLSKLPYVNRLFKNAASARISRSLMLMVTPRIIILEEEEEKLGLETTFGL